MTTVAAPPKAVTAAQLVSHILTPVVLGSALLLSTPVRHPEVSWLSAALGTVFTMLLPWSILAVARLRGKVSNIHVSQRHQRHWIYAVTALSMVGGLALLTVIGTATALYVEVGAFAVGLLLVSLINLWWKVSVHLAVGTYVVLHAFADVAPTAVIVLFVALLSWARVRCSEHTASQVFGGVLVGVVVSYLTQWASQLLLS
ncbi:hypothetical protein [Glutamicibacter endophyticus]|uniref:hypothetical protein n=1 Tax=Glutamicibacter endophyticus TaxID=1522174 RepID=UPI003AF106D1